MEKVPQFQQNKYPSQSHFIIIYSQIIVIPQLKSSANKFLLTIVLNLIFVTMKKQRKVDSKTDLNFFTTEFKLKSTQAIKDRPLRKLNTTCGLFKQHQSAAHNPLRSFSKEQRPAISQLTFLSTNQDNFRLPQSCSKRTMAKTHNQDPPRLQRKSDPSSETIHMDILTKDSIAVKKTAATHFFDFKAYKPSTVRTEMKQKLEKSALEKFKEAVHKENEQNQNVGSDKHAEALYEMLKTARMSKELGYRKFQQQRSREGMINREERPRDTTANTAVPKQKINSQLQTKQAPYPAQVYQQVTSKPTQTVKPLDKSMQQFSRSSDQEQSWNQQKSEKVVRQSSQYQTKQTDRPIQSERAEINQKEEYRPKQDLTVPSNVPKMQILQQTQNKKPVQTNNQPRQSPTQLNINKPQKVQTPKHADEGKKLKDVTVKTTIGPPPNLNKPPPKQQNPTKNNIQQDQIEQVSWGKKPALDKKPSQTKPPTKQKDAETHLTSKQLKPPQAPSNATQSPPTHTEDQDGESGSQQESPLDELIYYFQRIEDIGQYRLNSKDLYNDKSIDKELIQIYKICSYYMAHQFLYLAQNSYKFLSADSFSAPFYNLCIADLTALKQSDQLSGELQNMAGNIQESKKLLKRSYEQCKQYLQKDEQILLLDGRTNFHRKCCFTLIKQFRKIHELFQLSPNNTVITKRCWYLIELYFSLKLLNNEEIKGYEAFEEIEDPVQYIKTYKSHLIGK